MSVSRVLLPDEILQQFLPMVRYAFYPSPPLNLAEFDAHHAMFDERTFLGIFENDKLVSTVNHIPMTENIRGKLLPMSGVAGVISDPSVRRKGHIRTLMRDLFGYLHREGFPISTLYPFRESFYERLGYVSFPQIRRYKFKPAGLAPLLKQTFPGSVEKVHMRDAWDIYMDMVTQTQAKTHGMGMFPEQHLEYQKSTAEQWLAIARDEQGTVIGVMRYKITGFKEPLLIHSLLYNTPLARYLFLQWLAHHLDQVSEIDMKLSPQELPETWLSDLDVKVDPDIWLTALGRVIDIRGLAGLPVGEGRIVIDIEDADCPWNNGVWTFEGRNGELQVTEGGVRSARLTIQAFSALIYGTHDPVDFRWRGWGLLNDDTVQQLRTLFPAQKPFLFFTF